MFPQSLMCFNGVRMNCSGGITHEKGTRLMGTVLIIAVCLSVIVIINIERNNIFKVRSIENKYLVHPSRSYRDPTDLTDSSLNYGIIFDCGSSGTRIYIYYWPPHSGNNKDLLNIHQVIAKDGKPMSKKVTPGLSTYNKDAENAAEYLKPLLEFASNVIPKNKHKETPLYILATAGMRLINPEDAKAILNDITKDIPKWFEFHFEPSHVEVISGEKEGMFAWISLNYMLNRFAQDLYPSPTTDSPHGNAQHAGRKKTVGVVDMGGGSLQIAFEVPHSKDIKDEQHKMTFNLGYDDDDNTFKYTVYSATFLGYGANSAFSTYKSQLLTASNDSHKIQMDSCQAADFKYSVNNHGDNVTLRGSGDVQQCMNSLKSQLNLKKECSMSPCSINGIHQPSIPADSEFYGISEFWYSTHDVFMLNEKYNYGNVKFHAESFCKTPWNKILSNWRKNLYPKADMDRIRNECFKASWVMTALHDGLKFPRDYQNFRPINEIHGQEVQWSLGALVYKTRYLPSKYFIVGSSVGPHWSTKTQMLVPSVLVVCIAVAVAAIALYCRHLQKMKVVPQLRGVPSMSYFMTDPDEAEQGLIEEKHIYP